MIVPPVNLDPAPAQGKIAGMIRRLIHNAMRSSMRELIEPSLSEVKGSITDIKGSITDIKASVTRLQSRQDRLEEKIDLSYRQLDAKIDSSFRQLDAKLDLSVHRLDGKIAQLDKRMDDFGAQQGLLIKEVAALQRDHEITHDIFQRLGRIEDRLLRA